MDVINSVITYLQDFAAESEAVYHVNPWVFCILFFGSAIPLYYGYFRIARSVVHFENGKLRKKKLDKIGLRTGIVISSIAWLLPYVYVFVFGKLPIGISLVFWAFVLVTGFLFVRNLAARISNIEK